MRILLLLLALLTAFPAYAKLGLGLELGLSAGSSFAPPTVAAPVLTGTARYGETLTCTPGAITGSPTPTTAYYWERDGSPIGGETASTYVATMDDVGEGINCGVTATNVAGAASADSNTLTFSAFLDAVLSSTVFHVDATKSASYPGTGQTWANGVVATSTAYDFYLGNDANAAPADPTFTGDAGSSAAYFALDGGDFHGFVSGTNTAFLRDLHKTGGGESDFWYVKALKFQTDGGTQQTLVSTQSTSTGIGLRLAVPVDNHIDLIQRGSATVTGTHDTVTLVDDTDYLIISSFDHATSRWRISVNGADFTEITTDFSDTTTDATSRLLLGILGNFTLPLVNGTRGYADAMGNADITNADIASICAYFEHANQHNRNYCP